MRRLLALSALLAAALPAAAAAKPRTVTVMTRNLYLGADLTPGVQATSLASLAAAAGTILGQVDTNSFPTRAKGLAAEIASQHPDLVGLQEVALWRTEPCTVLPIPPKATQVRYDYLQLLLSHLPGYRAVVVEPEFDFEVYADTDSNPLTAAAGCPFGSETDGRLTMRDVILARKGVKTTNAKGANFTHLLQVTPSGLPIKVTRGWTRTDVKIAGVPRFRFVNTHLESFDDGTIRAAQAKELVARGGPAAGKLPVVLVGDLNSDVATAPKPGDALADAALLHAGFAERSTSTPFGCCLNTAILTVAGGGKVSDFDHKVDHVMTNAPKRVKLVRSTVTGRSPLNGFWDSDHAGLASVLRIR
jgi:endonuclease/exonuclease/phosphatase family metal-dependent hydrolase